VTLATLQDLVAFAERERASTITGLEAVTGRRRAETLAQLAPTKRAENRYYDVRDFGARGDGTGDDAPAINAAIAAGHAAGGGTVFVPAGIYDCGPIELRSHVTLALDPGVLIRGKPISRAGASAALLSGENLENVKLIGPGVIDATRAGVDAVIRLAGSRAIEIRGITLVSSGDFAMDASKCRELLIDNVSIQAAVNGLRLEGGRETTVMNSRIVAGREPVLNSTTGEGVQVTIRACVLTRAVR
jgi:polygalacturonase